MKNRKKIIAVMLAAVLSVCSGCGKNENVDDHNDSTVKGWTNELYDNEITGQNDGGDKDSSEGSSGGGQNDGQGGSGQNDRDAALSKITDGDENNGHAVLSDDNLKAMGHYSKVINNQSGKFRVKADAEIRAKQCDSYPVVRISTVGIDDEFLNKAKKALLGDAQLYDGIRMYNPVFDDYSGDKVEVGDEDKFQLEGKVPRSEITKYPVDTKLMNVSDNDDKYKDVWDYQHYYKELMPEGQLFNGVTDGKDGSYASLSVTNTKTYGNSLKFFKSREFGIFDGIVLPGINVNYSWPVDKGIGWIADERNPEMALSVPVVASNQDEKSGEYMDCVPDKNFKGYTFRESDKETNNISKEEAEKKAEDLLKELGISGIYSVTHVEERYISDSSTMVKNANSDGNYTIELTVEKVWDVFYQPSVNGNIVEDYGEMVKYASSGLKESVWFNSSVEVMINDNGIVGFSYASPIKYDEVMNENAKLLDLNEIQKIYEDTVLPTLNKSDIFYGAADDASGYDMLITVNIDDISLRYVRISDHESNEQGYLIPVWDFSGTAYNETDGQLLAEGSFLQINAIDGSIYNAFDGR